MSNKNKNRSTSAPSASVPANVVSDVPAVPAVPVETSETSAPSETSKPVPFAVPSVRDSLAYGTGSETSFLLSLLLEGKRTKPELLAAFLDKFAGSDADEIRKKKTTFSVFFSDVKRPIGTYHASRGLVIVVSDGGILSVTPESLAAAKKAIDAGILAALKGITRKGKPKAYAAVLARFGLALTDEKTSV